MRKFSFGQHGVNIYDKFLARLRSRQILKYLKDCDRLVDVGSGYNANFLKIAKEKFNIAEPVAIDLHLNPELQSAGIMGMEADANSPLPLESNSADYLVSLALLEHLFLPQSFLSEAFRILKPGGTLLFTTPTPPAKPVLEFLSYRLGIINPEEIRDHKNYFNSHTLKQMCEQAGFISGEIHASTFSFGFNNLGRCKK